METNHTPTDALADVDTTNSSLADRVITPWWHHPSLGLVQAVLVLTIAAPMPLTVQLCLVTLAFLGIGLLISRYKLLTGLWVDTTNLGPRSRRVYYPYAIACALIFVAAALVRFWLGQTWWAIAPAALIAAVTILNGPRIDDALRSDIRHGQATVQSAR